MGKGRGRGKGGGQKKNPCIPHLSCSKMACLIHSKVKVGFAYENGSVLPIGLGLFATALHSRETEEILHLLAARARESKSDSVLITRNGNVVFEYRADPYLAAHRHHVDHQVDDSPRDRPSD